MAFDVEGARRVVDRFLDDKLEVWRNGAGRADDVLDEITDRFVPPAGDEAPAWDGLGTMMPFGRPTLTPPLAGATVAQPPTIKPRLLGVAGSPHNNLTEHQ
ncbi:MULTISPECIES: hypothetical protein [Streptomyces]|uniref:Uncharacterized protein n=1 Tax=Streptomyces ramulosus TaxID=47762 RepID=A0ABW1FD20_9ACTN